MEYRYQPQPAAKEALQGTQNRGMLGSAGGDAINAIEKPRIALQLDQLEKVLAECHAITSSVEGAANRILGPTPETGEKTAGRPPMSSLEQRFADIISMAEGLAHRLGHASQRLNSAV